MATSWSLNPTAQPAVIEAVVLASHRRYQGFVRHPPVISSPECWFHPNELGHRTKSPMLDDLIGEDMMTVGQRPQVQVTALSREVGDPEIFQIAQIDRQVRQCIAHWPRRIDDYASHLGSVTSELDQIIHAASHDTMPVYLCRLGALVMAEQKARSDLPLSLMGCPQISFELLDWNSGDALCAVRNLPIRHT